MKIIIFGATGFVGQALVAKLKREGAEVLVRDTRRDASWESELATCEAVINLAGAPILGKRWDLAYMKLLRDSRVQTTDLIAHAIVRARKIKRGPTVFINASAVGYYGSSETAEFTETSEPGQDFLAALCRDWEEAQHVVLLNQFNVRCAVVRIGVVLGRGGGALSQMLPFFRKGLGGVMGKGNQWMSWIHLDDLTQIFSEVLAKDGAHGAYNATSPHPVSNRDFTKTLGRVLHRPTLLPVPAPIMRLALGESSVTVLGGQKVLPQRTREGLNFKFRYPDLANALQDILQSPPEAKAES